MAQLAIAIKEAKTEDVQTSIQRARVVAPEPAAPPLSYGELGLSETFADLVRKRQQLKDEIKPKEAEVKSVSEQIKFLFAEAILGAPIDHDAEDVKSLLAEIATTFGTTPCAVDDFTPVLSPGRKSTLDQSKLKLELLTLGLTLQQIEVAIANATTTTTWAELEVNVKSANSSTPGKARRLKG